MTKERMPLDLSAEPYQTGRNWYEDIYTAKENQLSLYRVIAITLSLFLCLSLLCITSLVTRETVQPFLALVDKRTGEVTTPTRLNAENSLVNWTMIRHFVTTYITNKESYNFLNINEPYQKVLAMSDEKVAKQIDLELRPEFNPNSPIKELGDHHYMTVTIHSVSKLSKDSLLDIRFTTTIFNTETRKIERTKEWRTTMKWALVSKKRTLAEWDINPLGFTVSFYDKQPVAA